MKIKRLLSLLLLSIILFLTGCSVDDVINNMLGVDIMSSVEEQVNPFERESINRENYLEVDASYSIMEDKEHDPDMVD